MNNPTAPRQPNGRIFTVAVLLVFSFPINITAAGDTPPSNSSWIIWLLLAVIVTASVTLSRLRERPVESNTSDWRQLLVDQGGDGMCLFDEDGRFLHFNPAMCVLTGFSAEELLSRSVADLDAEMPHEQVTRMLRDCQAGSSRLFRSRCRHKTGADFPVEIHIHTIRRGNTRQHIAIMRDISQTAEAEAQLRASESRYRTLVDHATDAIFLHDEAGRLLDVNRRACEMLGYTTEELLRLDVSAIDVDYPTPVARMLWESIADEDPVTLYGRHRRKDGTEFPVEVHLRAFLHGGERRFLALARDITERKKSEAALALSENRLRTIVESEPECVKLLSRDMRLLEMNPAGLAMVEADHPDDAIGQDVTQLVDEDDREAFIEINRRAFQGESGVLEFRMTGLKGSRRWLETHVAPLRDQDGKVIAALSITREITDRKRDEALLLRLLQGTAATSGEAFFRALVQSLAESLEVDFAFVGESFAPHPAEPPGPSHTRVRTLCAWAENRFIDNFQYDIAGTPCGETLLQGFRFYGQGLCDRFPDVALLREMKVESYMGAPLRTRDGRVIGILVVLHTKPMPSGHRRETVFNLFAERAGLELSRIQAQRNREELEEELRHAQKMESVGTLAGGIAHDFNNILGVVVGNADLARLELPPGHPALTSVDEISRAAQRATALVSQILAFSCRKRPSREVIRLDPVVTEATRMLRSMIPNAVELVTTIASGVPPVLAEADQMHQVIVNLCTNAWQATGEFAGRIEVRLDGTEIDPDAGPGDPALQPGLHARLTVIDDGAGMDADTMRRIFDPFFTTKGPDEGTGLGLAVVHGIVSDHDGKLRVSSEPGRGTSLTVLIPAVEDIPATSLPEVFNPTDGTGQRVLYIDDESALVRVAERVLTRVGYQCAGFTDPAAAVRFFVENPDDYDAVIADFNMPGLTGLEVLGRIRAVRHDIPLILSSGNFTDRIVSAAHAENIRELLIKPHSIRDLQTVLARVLPAGAQPDAARSTPPPAA